MTRNFESWEKDPLFLAAEQVQDSTDRLDSAYRSWIHLKALSLTTQESSALDFCRRELSTALGIAKWQLEEFEKEVSLLSHNRQQHAGDDTPQRHRQFIDAISNQLSSIKNELVCSKDERDLNFLPIVRLCQEESDQLADFLCGSRRHMCEDTKGVLVCCTSPCKGYKEMAKSCQSALSLSSSALDCGKVLFGNLDECSSSSNTSITVGTNEFCISKDCMMNRPENHWAMVKDADLLYVNVDHSNEGVTCAVSDFSMKDCYSSIGTCIERPNGHHQFVSLGSGLNSCIERRNEHHRTTSVDAGLTSWKDGSVCCEYKALPRQVASNMLLNVWHSVLKASLIFRVGGSSSNVVLKRWKDGEGDATEPCKILRSDIEQGCSIFLCQDGSLSELRMLQRFQKGISFGWLVQVTCAVLAIVGLVHLYLH